LILRRCRRCPCRSAVPTDRVRHQLFKPSPLSAAGVEHRGEATTSPPARSPPPPPPSSLQRGCVREWLAVFVDEQEWATVVYRHRKIDDGQEMVYDC